MIRATSTSPWGASTSRAATPTASSPSSTLVRLDILGGCYPRPRGDLAVQPLDHSGVGHAAALAHHLQAVPATAPLQLGEQVGHEAGARGAERVAERDGAPVGIDLRP